MWPGQQEVQPCRSTAGTRRRLAQVARGETQCVGRITPCLKVFIIIQVAKSQTWLSDFTFPFHFHALEKEMATHSSVLAWRIPGMGEPGGLPSTGSHRVGHDWSDLAAAAAGWLKQRLELRCKIWLLFFKIRNKMSNEWIGEPIGGFCSVEQVWDDYGLN